MSSFPLDEGQLVALFVQSVCHGIQMMTFSKCVWTLVERHRHTGAPFNWPWMMVSIVLFVSCSIDLALNLYHNLYAFVIYTGPGGAEGQFEHAAYWVNVTRNAAFLLTASVSDLALIYRSWVIFNRRYLVCIVPMILWVSSIGCIGADIYFLTHQKQSTSIPQAKQVRPYIIAFLTITLVLNSISTSLILYRIWSINRQTMRALSGLSSSIVRTSLSDINRIICESAVLYTLSVFVTLVTFLAGSNSYYAVSDISQELAGITFDLIIIRIGQGIATEQTQAFTETLTRPISLRVVKTAVVEARVDSSSTSMAGGEEIRQKGLDREQGLWEEPYNWKPQ